MKDWWKNTSFTKDDRDWKESVEKRLKNLEQSELHHIFEEAKPVPVWKGDELPEFRITNFMEDDYDAGFNEGIDIAKPIIAKLKVRIEELREQIKDKDNFANDLIETAGDFELERDKANKELQSLKSKLTKENLTKVMSKVKHIVPNGFNMLPMKSIEDMVDVMLREVGQ